MAKEANLNGYNWRGFAIVNLLVSKLHLVLAANTACPDAVLIGVRQCRVPQLSSWPRAPEWWWEQRQGQPHLTLTMQPLGDNQLTLPKGAGEGFLVYYFASCKNY